MTKYLISFPSGAMVVPDGDLQAVSDAAHAVAREAKDAGVWVFGGGLEWAAKLAGACRCAQEVRAFGYDPAS